MSLLLQDGAGQPVAGATVTLSAPAGAFAYPASRQTDAQGQAVFTLHLGRSLGAQTFVASAAGASLDLAPVAVAPPDGTLIPVVNAPRTTPNGPIPGPAAVAAIGPVTALAAATDGTLYAAGYNSSGAARIYAISPAGELTPIAGSGTASNLGDGGPALAAGLGRVQALALDEAGGKLYLGLANRVRVVDLAAGTIDLVAGGGGATGPGYGDNGPATAAAIGSLTTLRLGPDGALYLGDATANRFRRIAPGGDITAWLAGDANATCPTPTVGLHYVSDSDVAWDALGQPFVSGVLDNADTGSCRTSGIARVGAASALTQVAGRYYGGTADGLPARKTRLDHVPLVAFDPAGNLFFATHNEAWIRRIDGASGAVRRVAGSASAGSSGDFGLATQASLSSPTALVVQGRDLYFSDQSNNDVRLVWGAAALSAGMATLAVAGGSPGSALVDGLFAEPLQVLLLDAEGSPLQNFDVPFQRLDAGSVLLAGFGTTDGGVASLGGRAGLLPGDYAFLASYEDLHGNPVAGSPVTLTVTAAAPAPGTLFTAVNVGLVPATAAKASLGPGTISVVGQPTALAVASDGSIYFADHPAASGGDHVRVLTPAGELIDLAGNGTAGVGGDDGPARDAQLTSVHGLALDEAHHLLFLSTQFQDSRVRVIDLATGIISLYAGTGSASGPDYGDGLPATQAALASVGSVQVGPDGALYVVDVGHQRIRRIDPAAPHTISTWLQSTSSSPCSPPVTEVQINSFGPRSSIAWDGAGTAYISADVIRTPAACASMAGAVRRNGDGSLTHLAGWYDTTGTQDGIQATRAYFTHEPWIALDGAGGLYLSNYYDPRVRRVDLGSGLISTVAGTGAVGSSGDYGPGSSALLGHPEAIGFTPAGHLAISDRDNGAIRIVW